MSTYPKCPRCESILPGGNPHETDAECIQQMRVERMASTALILKLKRQTANALTRADEWKCKAKTGGPVKETNLARRVEKVEGRSSYTAAQLKEFYDRLVACEQRASFAVNQVAFLQQDRKPARRAS